MTTKEYAQGVVEAVRKDRKGLKMNGVWYDANFNPLAPDIIRNATVSMSYNVKEKGGRTYRDITDIKVLASSGSVTEVHNGGQSNMKISRDKLIANQNALTSAHATAQALIRAGHILPGLSTDGKGPIDTDELMLFVLSLAETGVSWTTGEIGSTVATQEEAA